MSTTYRIAEVAQRSGFTPAALRYYEDIGLVAPAGRTDASYRLYDETSLDGKAAATAEGPEGAAPIACTLDGADMATQLDEWNALLADEHGLLGGVTARRKLDGGGLRLGFGPGVDVTAIARLAAAEQGCCRFFRFALVLDDRGVALEVHAPPDGEPVLAALFGTAAA
jgi:hypothetical protein